MPMQEIAELSIDALMLVQMNTSETTWSLNSRPIGLNAEVAQFSTQIIIYVTILQTQEGLSVGMGI